MILLTLLHMLLFKEDIPLLRLRFPPLSPALVSIHSYSILPSTAGRQHLSSPWNEWTLILKLYSKSDGRSFCWVKFGVELLSTLKSYCCAYSLVQILSVSIGFSYDLILLHRLLQVARMKLLKLGLFPWLTAFKDCRTIKTLSSALLALSFYVSNSSPSIEIYSFLSLEYFLLFPSPVSSHCQPLASQLSSYKAWLKQHTPWKPCSPILTLKRPVPLARLTVRRPCWLPQPRITHH